jgi:hypothetical protein
MKKDYTSYCGSTRDRILSTCLSRSSVRILGRSALKFSKGYVLETTPATQTFRALVREFMWRVFRVLGEIKIMIYSDNNSALQQKADGNIISLLHARNVTRGKGSAPARRNARRRDQRRINSGD